MKKSHFHKNRCQKHNMLGIYIRTDLTLQSQRTAKRNLSTKKLKYYDVIH